MRVVGGTWRGQALDAPEGRGTRPTTDRMRETIASMVLSAQGLDLAPCAVLDAFAGSGGVGIELLSRGARSCTFVERNRRAAGVVQRNCKRLGIARTSWHVLVGDALRLVEQAMAGGPFDIVFLDPPYAMDAAEVARLLLALRASGNLAPGCLVTYERASTAPELVVAGFEALRSRSHGGTSIDMLRMGE